MSSRPYKMNPEIDAVIRETGNRADAAAAVELALMANRVVSELHKVARKIANEKRGTPEWGRWASLVNTSRDAVLRTAACRKTASQLAQQEARPEDDH